MRLMPTQKLVMTMMIQRVLIMSVFPVEMWAKPWMVEDSRNSRTSPLRLIVDTGQEYNSENHLAQFVYKRKGIIPFT